MRQRWYSREHVDRFILSSRVQRVIIAVILLNAAVLGVETLQTLPHSVLSLLEIVDTACLAVFVVEIALKLYAQRWAFFRDAWNVFDFLIVGIALIPASGPLAVLRALRVLRVLRLVSVVPALRRVVAALVRAVPGIASIAVLLLIIFYIGAVMATNLFGDTFPELFGSLGASLFSLLQITTLDNWSVISREVSAQLPWAPAFFIPFVLVSALTVLNLFIAVIVDAMQGLGAEDAGRAASDGDADAAAPSRTGAVLAEDAVLTELGRLREQVTALTIAVERTHGQRQDDATVG